MKISYMPWVNTHIIHRANLASLPKELGKPRHISKYDNAYLNADNVSFETKKLPRFLRTLVWKIVYNSFI